MNDVKTPLFTLLFVFLTLSAHSQTVSDQYLVQFSVRPVGAHVETHWRTGIDFTCSDVKLQYGIDSNALEVIYAYPGICGAEKEEKDYAYLHLNPPNGILYYQLSLGFYGKSKIQSIHLKKPMDYLAYPNPAKDKIKFEFPWVESGKVTINFHTPLGDFLKTMTFDVNHVDIDLSDFPLGVVYFSASFTSIGRTMQGKIVKIE